MDLTATLAGMPGAEPWTDLPDAWRWAPNPRFSFSAVLTTDRRHLLQVVALDHHDEDLVRSLLAFARDHSAEALGSRRPLTVLSGFTAAGHGFDTAVVAAPGAHRYQIQDASLHAVTYALFPGWHFEFSGTETESEALFLTSHPQGLRATRLDRQPVPFLRMSYLNTATTSRSTSTERALATADVLLRELPLLEDAPGSWVEFENFRGQAWRAEWNGTFVVTGEGSRLEFDRDGLLDFARNSLT
ncbi:hypothetical protein AB0K43_13175 [Kitasatospora sp. NPDC049258]|uniref:hypothetical protein n=1 Tax=Kitasatospora sp. NPDC049258 TaxID=3155394 RepID=UPI0034421DC7